MRTKTLISTRVRVITYLTGHKEIDIHGLSKEQLTEVAELLGKEVQENEGVLWVETFSTRDKCKTVFFQGGE